MNTIKVTTTQNIELEYDLASLGERIVGRIVDGLVLAAYIIVILLIVYWANGFDQLEWMILIFILPIFFYDLVSEIVMNGQSVGKRVMNIKVISLDGGQPTLGQYLIRWIFRLIDFTFSSQLCGLIAVAVSERKQRVGDMVAGTTVIKTIPRTAFQQTIYVPTEQEGYTVRYPEVSNLTDRDMQLIKEVLVTVQKTGNTMLAYQAAVKIKDMLKVESQQEPGEFLQTLMADYNHLTARE